MTKKTALALVLAGALALGAQMAQGVRAETASLTPGSAEDPLVTKSYVAQLEAKADQLQSQVNALQGALTALQQKVTALEARLQGTGANPSTSKTATLVANQGYFRAGPATAYKVLAVLKKGATMKVLGQSADWYKVQLANGQVGWIWSKVVTVK